jgi:uncharacterized protein involved in exopolysaccharide biosynthesis
MSGTENNAPAPKRSKRRWFVWLVLGVIAGVALYLLEPRVYRASTSILIIPQRVPVRFVEPAVTATLNERLNMVQQQILSRTRLERIIQEFNLYERERRQMIMEDVIERMRDDINVNIARPQGDDGQVSSFSVAFDATDPRTAMRVTERLASLFVLENIEDRERLADQTDQFLKGELEEMRRRLVEKDIRVRDMQQRGLTAPPIDAAEYGVLLEHYKEVLRDSEASKMAVNLERRQIGEQFKIIDGARLPERPISPRPFPYFALGALAGLATGIVFSIASWAWRRRRTPSIARA